MIVRIINLGGGAWLAASRDGGVSHNCGADYFPPEVIAATAEEGEVVFYEATLSRERGELDFGPPSTLEAYEAN